MSESHPYVGRFAPSPTGPLHFGSLLAALASKLEAHQHDGQWFVRIDDIDPPREQPGASNRIIDALDAYGFEWDGNIIFQSASASHHRAALEQLLESGAAYHCGCSRRDLRDELTGSLGQIYPGNCRNGTDATETAIRVRTINEPVEFVDDLQGKQALRLESESGDFIIFRRDGLVAYQLAVVVDDHQLGVTDIVRGIDLMDSTPRQIWLQRLLDYPTPRYAHIPVAVHANGDKLSKLTGAAGIPLDRPAETMLTALKVLGQNPPATLISGTIDEVWTWAKTHWTIEPLIGKSTLAAEDFSGNSGEL